MGRPFKSGAGVALIIEVLLDQFTAEAAMCLNDGLAQVELDLTGRKIIVADWRV